MSKRRLVTNSSIRGTILSVHRKKRPITRLPKKLRATFLLKVPHSSPSRGDILKPIPFYRHRISWNQENPRESLRPKEWVPVHASVATRQLDAVADVWLRQPHPQIIVKKESISHEKAS
ncbi:hypothetical protein ACFX13_002926 [Malus domestica]